ncbi:unnamed protein product [Staurois parvus]|uniref:Uncharacterized protein n=1 Tax=Staurois parvus TaxID=386267 RepID=A0ABN9HVH2_9NEOB|nr:unnamed protein product [Staurois parvus]
MMDPHSDRSQAGISQVMGGDKMCDSRQPSPHTHNTPPPTLTQISRH